MLKGTTTVGQRKKKHPRSLPAYAHQAPQPPIQNLAQPQTEAQPRRAPEQQMSQRNKLTENITRLPTRPSGQPSELRETSALFVTESSLQALSLILAETSPALSAVSGEPPTLDIDVYKQALRRETPVPPALTPATSSRTTPQAVRDDRPARATSATAMQPRRDRRDSQAEPLLFSRPSWPHANGPFKFGWRDALRWWLLYPGRMEFLLWLLGSLLLTIVTGALIVAVLWSVGWLHLAISTSLILN
ncbi:hypothetical protein Krac_11145 [Ktedonobacter racemifer DSM 44963]|uniref:Uncharacterized protein n=2 Tax=Ktedonobacter racemifer TaxID=363277 RepID=D6TJH3_KTERA|nr:hypothetical protein Krac_11145 [Ktedonobacter racemifer DSM 44963]